MKIRSLTLSNYQCWNGDYYFEFDKYNCFIGENNVGKSAIQDAIIVNITNQYISLSKINRDNWSQARIILSISLEENDVKLIIQNLFPHIDDLPRAFLKVVNAKRDFWHNLVIYNVKATPDYYREDLHEISDAKFLGVWQEESPDPITFNTFLRKEIDRRSDMVGSGSDFEGEITKLEDWVVRFIMQNIIFIQSKRQIKESEHISENINVGLKAIIDSHYFINDGTNLRRLLLNVALSEDDEKKKLYHKFQDIVNEWSFSVGRPDITAETGRGINLIFRNEGKKPISMHELGDGLKEALIIAAICITNPEKVIIIEEPELYLHPRALRELRRLFIEDIEGQVILSTHNPILLGEIEEGVRIFKIIKDQNKMSVSAIRNMSDYIEFKNQFDLRNSDFLFYDYLIFVEGKSDYGAFSEWIKELFGKEKYVGIIKFGGSGEIPAILTLSFMLQINLCFKYIIITDRDDFSPDDKKQEIIDRLKGKDNDLVRTIGEEEIKKYLYILKKKNLEEYFKGALRVIAEDWEIEFEELSKLYSPNKTMISNIKTFEKSFNKTFKKSRDIPRWASRMRKDEIDPEIENLLKDILDE